MPENGGGRLDRIEAALEQTGQHIHELTTLFHEMVDHHNAEFKQLMTWQVLMQDKMDRMQDKMDRMQEKMAALDEKTDRRIADLVSAIGKLVGHTEGPGAG